MNFDLSGTECIVIGILVFMAYVGCPHLLLTWDRTMDQLNENNRRRNGGAADVNLNVKNQ